MPLPLRRAPPTVDRPSFGLHVAKNLGFILASLLFLPLSVFLCAIALIWARLVPPSPPRGSMGGRKLTIMVSGMRTTKGLVLAREFARAGHRVIALEEASYRLSSGRFSNTISAFHILPDPLASQSAYTAALVRIAQLDKVDVYVPACGVATTLCDGIAKPALEKVGCKVLQFDKPTGEKLDKKDLFMKMCEELGLDVPTTKRVTTVREVMEFDFDGEGAKGRDFIIKCVGVDDRTRNDMTRFPMADRNAMKRRLEELKISEENPYILQEFVTGTEYLSQSLVASGHVLTFAACESSDLLVNYSALPASHPTALAALAFTRRFAAAHALTGQIAFDFIARADGHGLAAIECNPRTHTAVALYAGQPAWARAYVAAATGSAEAYLAEQKRVPLGPRADVKPVYWIGHELFDALRFREVRTLLHRLVFEKEGTWDVYDPLPWVALYHVQWPLAFLESLWSGRRWTRVNVSTGKVFWC